MAFTLLNRKLIPEVFLKQLGTKLRGKWSSKMDKLKWSTHLSIYLGSRIDSTGGSRGEVLQRIGIAWTCMNLLENGSESQALQARYQDMTV